MKATRVKLLLALALCFCLLPDLVGARGAEKLDSFLQSEMALTRPGTKVAAIVRMKNPASIRPFATPSRQQGPIRMLARSRLVHALKNSAERNYQPLEKFLSRHGMRASRKLWLINGIAVQATPTQLEAMSRIPEVASIVADRVVTLAEPSPEQTSVPAESNINQLRAPDLWDRGFTGQGVTVAVVDSGVDYNHPDLGPRWRGGNNSWYDPNGNFPVPTDLDGHGTKVAGLILGGDHSGAYIGVAPEADWIGVKIFESGSSSYSVIHAGYQWLLDPDQNPDTDDAPDIVNNSWGFEDSPNSCDDLADEFREDLQTMKAAGMAVLFAAGNTGPTASTSISPANYPEGFAVGSIGTSASSTVISSSSARGPSACDGTIYPEVVAPGYMLLTSALTNDGTIPNSYVQVEGTSFAVPQASGVMALLLSAFPDTSIKFLESALKLSATDLGTIGADNSYGYGLINSLAAFNYLADLKDLEVTDSRSPETDGEVAFGSIPPGVAETATVIVRNSGNLVVTLGRVDAGNITAPFTLDSENCSNQQLMAGEICSIDVRFAPALLGSFNGSLEILTDIEDRERITIRVTGTGNTPPAPPHPLAPQDGAKVGSKVTFSWLPASDAEGSAVSQFVIYSPHADFRASTTRQVETVPAPVSGAGGLLLAGLLAFLRPRRKLVLSMVVGLLLFIMFACGGGGGEGADPEGIVEIPAEAQSTTINGLVPGTTYYWKMVARDSYDAETASATRTFSVE